MLKVGLEHVFTMRVQLGERMHTEKTPHGWKRGFVGVKGGTIEGPRLQGAIVENTGGDYPYINPDGSAVFEAQYLIKASDGTLIVLKNRGFRHGPPEQLQALLDNKEIDPTSIYFRLAPSFDAPIGPHDWLTKTVFVGTGNRKPDHSVFTYYAVV